MDCVIAIDQKDGGVEIEGDYVADEWNGPSGFSVVTFKHDRDICEDLLKKRKDKE